MLAGSKKLTCALGLAALYGILNYATIGWCLPGAATVVSVRPQVVLPLLAGYLMGPGAGFIVGCAGNFLGDWLSGWGVGYWPFSIGNGLMGASMGLLVLAGVRRIESVAHFAWLLLALAGSNVLCIGSGLFAYNLIAADSLQQLTWEFFHPIVISNVMVSFLLVPPLLALMKRISGTFDVRIGASIFYLLVLAVVPMAYAVKQADYRGMRMVLAGHLSPDAVDNLVGKIALVDFRIGGTIWIVALLGSLAVAFLMVQYVSRPIRALMRAANQLRDGQLDQIDLEGLASQNDELGRLAQVFKEAVGRVKDREASLKLAIQRLKVDIDREQEASQVSEITETEYFRSLRQKSMELRKRKKGLGI